MLTKIDQEIAQELKWQIEKIIPILSFQVFGSRARGDHHDDSDLDIFIMVENVSSRQRQAISKIAATVGFEKDRVITTFVATLQHINEGALGAAPIIRNIEKEGIRL